MVGRNIVRAVAALGMAAALWLGPGPAAHAQDEVTWLLTQINNLRASLGLPPYRLNPQLSAAATLHSQYMVETCDVSHTEANGSTPASRARAQGYSGSWISENIYMGQLARAQDAWNFWLNSPIHYQGLTHNVVNEVGIGVAYGPCGQGYTLLFGHRDGVSAPAAPPAENPAQSSAPPPPTQAPYVPPPPTRTPTPTVPTLTPSYTWTPTTVRSPTPTATHTQSPTATASPTALVLPTVAASNTLPPTAVAVLPTASSPRTPTPLPTPATADPLPPAAPSLPRWLPLALLAVAALLATLGGWLFWRAR